MSTISRGPLVVLCVTVLLYAVLSPFMNPAPYVLALVFIGLIVAAIVELLLARRHAAAEPTQKP